MGRDAKPLYSYWDGETLTYVESRKKIYIPLYAKYIQKNSAFEKLKNCTKKMQKFISRISMVIIIRH